jgi:peptide deformylase
MALLNILEYPDPRLRTKARPVELVTPEIQQLVNDMLETMYDAPGIGLAASQVNVHKRIIVVDVSEERDTPYAFVNPEIAALGGQQELQEGCLSIPGFYEIVNRADRIKVSGLDAQGKPIEVEADGLLSVCIQHEADHLEGKLFVDYLSSLKRQRIRKKLEKLQRQQA